MRKILKLLPLAGVILGFLLLHFSYPSQVDIVFAFILIFGSMILLIWFNRKTFARINQLQALTRQSMPTGSECPKCHHELDQALGELPQLYACPNCGYTGSVALKPLKRKKISDSL